MESLPEELILKIFTYLRAKDLVQLCRVDRLLYRLSNDPLLWRAKCRAEYPQAFDIEKSEPLARWNVPSFKHLYFHMHKWRFTFGLWACQPPMSPRGMLLYIRANPKTGLIEGLTYLRKSLSVHGEPELNWSRVFTISFESPSSLPVLHTSSTPNTCTISPHTVNGVQCLVFSVPVVLSKEDFPQLFLEDTDEEFILTSRDHDHSFLNRMFRIIPSDWLTVPPPPAVHTAPPPSLAPNPPPLHPSQLSGIFWGLYGPHGLEVLRVVYDSKQQTITGRKITGDPNVPAWEISFTANVSQALNIVIEPTETGQEISNTLRQRLLGIITYEGRGHIANTGYTSPSTMPGSLVIMTRNGTNTFMFAWMGMGSVKYWRLKLPPLTVPHNEGCESVTQGPME